MVYGEIKAHDGMGLGWGFVSHLFVDFLVVFVSVGVFVWLGEWNSGERVKW